MRSKRILVADDEPQIQHFLKVALTSVGYDVLSVATGKAAIKDAFNLSPDLILLDLGLPDIDGKSVISEIRKITDIPIIVVSARGLEIEKIDALDRGADDYIEKPFKIGELLARIRTALRHRTTNNKDLRSVKIGNFKVDIEKRLVSLNNQIIKLTPKEYDLLLLLITHTGRVLTHRQILSSLWGPAHTEDIQYLRVFIAQLRSKIEPDPNSPRLIMTEPSVGYRFVEVETPI